MYRENHETVDYYAKRESILKNLLVCTLKLFDIPFFLCVCAGACGCVCGCVSV